MNILFKSLMPYKYIKKFVLLMRRSEHFARLLLMVQTLGQPFLAQKIAVSPILSFSVCTAKLIQACCES